LALEKRYLLYLRKLNMFVVFIPRTGDHFHESRHLEPKNSNRNDLSLLPPSLPIVYKEGAMVGQ
jgi:hypothetical protein